MKRRSRAGVLAVFFLAGGPAAARGQGVDQGLNVEPRLIAEGENRANLFQTPTDQEHEFLTVLRPGLALSLPVQTHELDVRGEGFLIRHAEFPEFDSNEFRVDADADFDLVRGLDLGLSNRYRRSSNPPLSAEDQVHLFREEFARALPRYRFAERWQALLKAAYLERRFEAADEQRDDFTTYTYGGGFGYRVLPKTTVLVEGDSNRIDHFTSLFNNTLWRATLGAVWETTEKLEAQVHSGFERKNYARNQFEDHGDWMMAGDLRYRPTDFDEITLRMAREIIETEFTSRENVDSGLYYVSTSAELGYSHQITAKFKVVLAGRYALYDFSGTRSDRIGLGRGGLEYAPRKWLALSATAGYAQDDSNQNSYDYADQSVLAAVKLTYPAAGVSAWLADW